MTQDLPLDMKYPNSDEFAKAIAKIIARSQRLTAEWLERQAIDHQKHCLPDISHIGNAFLEMSQQILNNPTKFMESQIELWQNYACLWHNTTEKLSGKEVDPLITPEKNDRRFKNSLWEENEVFDFIKQSYLLTARWIQGFVGSVEGLDPKTQRKIEFYTKQFTDALAPSNFVMTNPEVLKTTLESGGENLLNGLNNLLEDLERGKGQLMIRMTDLDAFRIGENIAITSGKVIYQNDLMQLIQYTPTTKEVYAKPLMIIPPWINKYYILDLRPQNSFIKWAIDQGYTVFVISWVNPTEDLASKSFEDYMKEGPLKALDVIEKATNQTQVNAVGYCLGGTLLATMLAYMTVKEDKRLSSATFLTTMTDFSDVGELSVFIDEEQLSSLEEQMRKKGYLEGREMATTFNLLRANDLIWSFVVNNYLLGKEPFPFDLLYWNSDSTRMPAEMHSFYLRQMYQNNKLIEAGGIVIDDIPIDLKKITLPCYFLSTQEDHIAPWKSTYKGSLNFSSDIRFVLSASGHIAGVVNHPNAQKYCYWTNPNRPHNPEEWFENAEQTQGSWWKDWEKWLQAFSGDKVTARNPGVGKVKALEDAPGSYVKVRAV